MVWRHRGNHETDEDFSEHSEEFVSEEELPRVPPQVKSKLAAYEWSRYTSACVDGKLEGLPPFDPNVDIDNIEEYTYSFSSVFCDVLGDEEYRLAVRNRLQTILLKSEDVGFVLGPEKVEYGVPYRAVCNFVCTCRQANWLENSWRVRQDQKNTNPVDAETSATPVCRCKWCGKDVKAKNIRPFNPCRKEDYCLPFLGPETAERVGGEWPTAGYWPRPHDATNCPRCIRKGSWCPKKLCHAEPRDYAQSLDELFRRDASCIDIGSPWKLSSHKGRNFLKKEFRVVLKGKSKTFELMLSPEVYIIPRALPRVLANLRDPAMRDVRTTRCPDFGSSEVWTGRDVLLALNRSVATDSKSTPDEKTIVFNRVAEQLLDGGCMTEAVDKEVVVSDSGWWRYPLSGPPGQGKTIAYHGTHSEGAIAILSEGLRPPGQGDKPRHGQSGSDSKASVYTSPCLSVAAFPVYSSFFGVGSARKGKHVSWAQVVFEVEVPEEYTKHQPGTLSHHTHWPRNLQFQEGFKANSGLEWLYDDPSQLRLVAILVRGFGKGADMFGELNSQVRSGKKEPQFLWTELLQAKHESERLWMEPGRSLSAYAYDAFGRRVVGNFTMQEGTLVSCNASCLLCDDERVGRVAVFLNGERKPQSARHTSDEFIKFRSHGGLVDPRDCGKMILTASGAKVRGKRSGRPAHNFYQ